MKEKILKILIDDGGFVSGQDISAALGVSRQSVWKAICSLREEGCKIESVTNRGYRLAGTPDYLSKTAVKSNLHTAVLGKNLTVLETVGSTNDWLKARGAHGCESGTVAAAREQTKGKGRLGRVWQSKKDDCLAFSFLLRPHISPSEAGVITPLCGLAVCEALRASTGLDCKIKWPNDVIVGRKKLVGILTEMSAESDAVEYIIVGIGINVEHSEFPDDIAEKATSVYLESGRHTDKNKLLALVLEYIERELAADNLSFTPDALGRYEKLCASVGRKVSFSRADRKISGTAEGIEPTGELRVACGSGEVFFVNSGEVTVQGIY